MMYASNPILIPAPIVRGYKYAHARCANWCARCANKRARCANERAHTRSPLDEYTHAAILDLWANVRTYTFRHWNGLLTTPLTLYESGTQVLLFPISILSNGFLVLYLLASIGLIEYRSLFENQSFCTRIEGTQEHHHQRHRS